MIRILVVENEAENHDQLLRRMARQGDVQVLANCCKVREIRERVESLRPDAVFVSTETADFSGLERLFAGISTGRPHLVVMSPTSRHAVDAFAVNAVDYLLTPLDIERLGSSLLRLRRIMEADQRLERKMDMETLVSYLREHVTQTGRKEEERVPINFGGRIRFVALKGICYATADRDYVDIHMATGEVLHSTNRLSELAAKLPRERFLRIRRSVIVNIEHVREARAYKENYEVLMDDGTRFRPGSTYKVGVREALVNRLNPGRIRSVAPDLLGLFAKA